MWEKRWRELLRWELYAGLCAAGGHDSHLGCWFVYAGPDGPAHLKVFFWNNLVGRFTRTSTRRMSCNTPPRIAIHPASTCIELPLYLWPWTLAGDRRPAPRLAQRKAALDDYRPGALRPGRLAAGAALLSLAATARNIYLAPALPGFALLLGWWAREILKTADRWDLRALRGTCALAAAGGAGVHCRSQPDRRRRLEHHGFARGIRR
jgi:hypothetical protein